MTADNRHIIYTLEDIERYLNNGMTTKEMHDMEKAALQDPFLADAIEGYRDAGMEQSHRHLNELSALLQKEKTPAAVIEMPVKNIAWWKVAAMVIVIAGAGIFSWYIISNKEAGDTQEVAAVKKSEPLAIDTVTTTPRLDTTGYIAENKPVTNEEASSGTTAQSNAPAAPEHADRAGRPAARLVYDSAAKDAFITNNFDSLANNVAIASAQSAASDKKNVFTPIQSEKARAVMESRTLNSFPGVVKDDNNQPVANAVIKADRQRSAVTDENGYFNILAPDSALKVTITSVGFASANVHLAKGQTSNITIEPDKATLSEMVVTGYNSKKKSEANAAPADSTFPSGGWQSFQEYVYRKMNRPIDSSNNKIITPYGSTEIEFSIDEKGNPYDFNVLKSSGKENDDKAIKALKEGPKWITLKKERKGKVTIQP